MLSVPGEEVQYSRISQELPRYPNIFQEVSTPSRNQIKRVSTVVVLVFVTAKERALDVTSAQQQQPTMVVPVFSTARTRRNINWTKHWMTLATTLRLKLCAVLSVCGGCTFCPKWRQQSSSLIYQKIWTRPTKKSSWDTVNETNHWRSPASLRQSPVPRREAGKWGGQPTVGLSFLSFHEVAWKSK